jgi:hypothetical protein
MASRPNGNHADSRCYPANAKGRICRSTQKPGQTPRRANIRRHDTQARCRSQGGGKTRRNPTKQIARHYSASNPPRCTNYSAAIRQHQGSTATARAGPHRCRQQSPASICTTHKPGRTATRQHTTTATHRTAGETNSGTARHLARWVINPRRGKIRAGSLAQACERRRRRMGGILYIRTDALSVTKPSELLVKSRRCVRISCVCFQRVISSTLTANDAQTIIGNHVNSDAPPIPFFKRASHCPGTSSPLPGWYIPGRVPDRREFVSPARACGGPVGR